MRINLNKLLLAFVSLLFTGIVQNAAAVEIEHWLTKNGARVYFVPAPELPIVDVEVVFDAGAARDGNQPGLALLTNTLLVEGAGNLNAQQISERFDELGAQFGSQSERDMAAFTLRSLSDANILNPALDTMAMVLAQPMFPNDAFERERSRLLIGLEQRKQSPSSLASEAFYKSLYSSHPYATEPEGNEASVKAITVDNLKAFYKKYYVANNAIIAIVGNLDKAGAEQVAEKLVSQLENGQAAAALPEVKNLADAQNVKISHPSAQTHILVGQPGISRGDPDYFALYVGNHILGGSGLVARLSNEIREKRGLSYSSYSYFLPMRKDGPYTIGLQTRNDQADEALKVLNETVKSFINEGPTAEELIAAKRNITGGFPLRIASNKKILGYIAMIGFYGLPLDYLTSFNDKIDALSIDDIKKAFQSRVNPDKMVTVLVGGAAGSS